MEHIPLEPRPPSEANLSEEQSRENTNTTLQTDSIEEGALLVGESEPGEQQENPAANGSDEADEEGRGPVEIEPHVQFRPEDPLVPEANGAQAMEAKDDSDEEEEEGGAKVLVRRYSVDFSVVSSISRAPLPD